MQYVVGKAGKLPEAKFVKTVGLNTFSYTGDLDEIVFLEELVFKGLSDIELEEPLRQAMIIFEDRIALLNFDESDEGRGSVEYSREEFTDEEINDYLIGLIDDMSNVIFVEEKEEGFEFSREKDGLKFTKSLKEIKPDVSVSEFKKAKKILFENWLTLLLLLAIIAVPTMSFSPMKERFVDAKEIEVKGLRIQENKAIYEKTELKKELTNDFLKIKKIESTPDFFENVEAVSKLLNITY